MSKSAYVNVRVNEITKRKAEEIFTDLGINTSIAIDMFLQQVINKDGIPFQVKRQKKSDAMRRLELASVINQTGGKDYPPKLKKILKLYANDDISYDVAVFAIKKEFANVWYIRVPRYESTNQPKWY